MQSLVLGVFPYLWAHLTLGIGYVQYIYHLWLGNLTYLQISGRWIP